MDSVYSAIRNIRTQKGYSQEYMAQKLGMNQSSYAKLERGGTQLTVERLNQIAQIFDVDAGELLGLSKVRTHSMTEMRSEKEQTLEIRIEELKEQLDDKRQIIKYLRQERSYSFLITELHDLYFDLRRQIKEQRPSLDPRKVTPHMHPFDIYEDVNMNAREYFQILFRLAEVTDVEYFEKYPRIGQLIEEEKLSDEFLQTRWEEYKTTV